MNSTSMSSTVPTIKCEDTSPSAAAVSEGGEGGHYNLSVNVNVASSGMLQLLTAEGAGGAGGAALAALTALRTPEIVNDVITMTNPLDQLDHYQQTSTFKPGCGQDSSSSMSNGSSATSPASSSTPSIQKTCSELIKAGLKLSIESKRKMSGSDTDAGLKRVKREDSEDEYDSSSTALPGSGGLTPEDEERRRRRRERNKIAATKCRMKKRERTCNLVTESEVLENQNIDLKAQLKELEVQKRQLIDMLSVHAATCVKRGSPGCAYGSPAPPAFPAYDAHSPYLRPESADVLASGYSCGDACSADALYASPLEGEYALGAPPATDAAFLSADGFLPKGLLVEEYYEPEPPYGPAATQQHTYPGSADAPHHAGLDGCLV